MLALSTLLATLPALALAQSSTITTSLFGLNSELGYVASVVNSDQSAITYGIACTGGASCIPGYTATLTEGPSTVQFHYSSSTDGIAALLSLDCKLAGTTSATCQVTVSESFSDTSVSTATGTSYTGSDMPYVPVTVTAGAQKLASSTASSTATSTSAANAISSSFSSGTTLKLGLLSAAFAVLGASTILA